MIKQSSPIYQLFLSVFFKDDGEYPFNIECPSPGKAISLAQKLNQCRKQHIGEAPENICPLSAKAQGNTVTISQRATRIRSAEWIQTLASVHNTEPEQSAAFNTAFNDASNMHMPWHSPDTPATARPDSQDELLNKWYKSGGE